MAIGFEAPHRMMKPDNELPCVKMQIRSFLPKDDLPLSPFLKKTERTKNTKNMAIGITMPHRMKQTREWRNLLQVWKREFELPAQSLLRLCAACLHRCRASLARSLSLSLSLSLAISICCLLISIHEFYIFAA